VPWLALGSLGGSSIIGTVLNVLLNVVDHKLPLENATLMPRGVARNTRAGVFLEAPLHEDAGMVSWLRARGIIVAPARTEEDTGHRRPLGFVQSVIHAEGGYRAVADVSRMPTAAAAGH